MKANAGTLLAYLLVTVGAGLRVAAGFGWFDYRLGLNIAGTFWAAAFLLFLVVYGPMLFRKRIDEADS